MRRPHSQLTVIELDDWSDIQYCRKGGATPDLSPSHFYRPLCQGGLFFFEGEDVTPALRLLHTNRPVTTDTCDMWFDEHIVIDEGVLQEDGCYYYEAEFEVFRLAQDEADRIKAEAETFNYGKTNEVSEYAPFYLDRVNEFDEPMAREYKGVSGVFFAREDESHLTSWNRTAGPEGKGALILNSVAPVLPPGGQHYQGNRYDLLADPPWIEHSPLAFLLDIPEGAPVQFSAMIRTEGDVKAWLELREALYGLTARDSKTNDLQPQLLQVVRTKTVTSSDWQHVSARLTGSGPLRGSQLYMYLEGNGRAMFSHLLVKRL